MLGGGFGTWVKLKSPLSSNSKPVSHCFDWAARIPLKFLGGYFVGQMLHAVCSRKVSCHVVLMYSSCTDCARTASLYCDTVSTFKMGIISEMLFYEMWCNVVSYIGIDVSEEPAEPSWAAPQRRINLHGVAPHWTEMLGRSDSTHCYVPSIPCGSRHRTDIGVNFTLRYIALH